MQTRRNSIDQHFHRKLILIQFAGQLGTFKVSGRVDCKRWKGCTKREVRVVCFRLSAGEPLPGRRRCLVDSYYDNLYTDRDWSRLLGYG